MEDSCEVRHHIPIEEMEVFARYVAIADWAWEVVTTWPELAKGTVGRQLVRALDSVGANLVEGDGRFSSQEGLHFFVIVRASARESKYWLHRAIERKLISEAEGSRQIAALVGATQLLNKLISYRRSTPMTTRVREPGVDYDCNLAES